MIRITGVDVASYQGETYDTAGLSFSIVKATEGAPAEGTQYTNPKYAAQVACARSAGLVVGHYHYARSTNSAAEVDYFASVANVKTGDLIALDWEESSVTPAARDEWLKTAKARFPHNKVILYCDLDFWENHDPTKSAADGLWIAEYNGKAAPDITEPWVFWQFTDANGMDRSYGNFATLGALVAWCLELQPTTNPAAPTDEDDPMTVTSVNGRAGIAWPTGKCHAIGVNYDGAGNTAPKLRVVMCLHTGPWVVTEAWEPNNGCDALALPAEHVPNCQGVILEDAARSVYDVTAA